MPDKDREDFEYEQRLKEGRQAHLRWLLSEVLPSETDQEPVLVIGTGAYRLSWTAVKNEDGRLIFEGFWMEPIR